ncbi:hypothetical protein [Streptomyces sp. NPDC001604]|uniref:hypothetical protein n=1 Tax=Streptomyces sp. NPDC001604 TaxID=3364593 RepID=UPI0036A9B2E8
MAALLAGAVGTWLGLWNGLAVGTLALAVPFLVLRSSSLAAVPQSTDVSKEADR